MILSLLEYTALRVGIVPRPELLGLTQSDTNTNSTPTGTGGLLWSGIADGIHEQSMCPDVSHIQHALHVVLTTANSCLSLW
eukprot:COSAG01_NODE_11817_length_1853_cov_13.852971_2_plen_81_part_00